MAIPDPYKAAKPKPVNNAVPTSGMIPTPVAGSSSGPSVKGVPSSPGVSTPTSLGVPKSPTIPTPQISPKAAFSAPQYNDWQAKQNEQYANLEKLMQSQFSYDPESDPAYQAQRELSQLRAGDATKNAMEAANEKGVFGSSLMTNQMGQIQQRAEQEAAAYIPQYRDQAYGQFQDRIANAGSLLGQANALRSQGFNEAVTEGELTGQYMSPQARTLLDSLFDLKSQAEASDITREARAGLSSQADGIRAQLGGMGVDPSLFGSDVSLDTARGNMGQAGLSTMAKQAQEYGQQADQRDFNFQQAQQEWDNNFQQGQFDWQKAQQTWDNAFQDRSFEQSMQEAAASRGLQWASLGQRDKEIIADQAFREKQFEYEQGQDTAEANNISPLIDEFNNLYVSEDPYSGQQTVNNPDALRDAIIARRLPDEQTDQMLLYYGLPVG